MDNNKGYNFLLSHCLDLQRTALDGIPCHTQFLNGGEIIMLAGCMNAGQGSTVFYGGYDEAERKMLFFLPEYMSSDSDIASEYIKSEMFCVRIHTSGYEKLNHSSFLGALTGAGIDRSHIGDILVDEDGSAYVFCDEYIHHYLLNESGALDYVGRDKVKLSDGFPPEDYDYSKHFAPIGDTVASARLDCVVSAICNISREKAESAIASGLCTHNYVIALQKSAEVRNGDIISVRSHGKYKIDSIDGLTKKGRLRLIARKYI